jgi:hypothetical protein
MGLADPFTSIGPLLGLDSFGRPWSQSRRLLCTRFPFRPLRAAPTETLVCARRRGPCRSAAVPMPLPSPASSEITATSLTMPPSSPTTPASPSSSSTPPARAATMLLPLPPIFPNPPLSPPGGHADVLSTSYSKPRSWRHPSFLLRHLYQVPSKIPPAHAPLPAFPDAGTLAHMYLSTQYVAPTAAQMRLRPMP